MRFLIENCVNYLAFLFDKILVAVLVAGLTFDHQMIYNQIVVAVSGINSSPRDGTINSAIIVNLCQVSWH